MARRPLDRGRRDSAGRARRARGGRVGFAAPERTREIGVGQRRAVGFPAWALVHDPANAHHALNLVKDLERIARLARSSDRRPPIEEWKKPMFGPTHDGQQLGPQLPLRPVADQFRLAWQRIQDGDAPRYAELRTGGHR
jgi:hypothetical protein